MKKKGLVVFLSALLMLLCFTLGVSAAEADLPSAEITAKNLSYADSLKLLVAVKAKNYDTVELQVFSENTTEFTDETAAYTVTQSYADTVLGEKVRVFYSKGISAKNIADAFFIRAKVTKGETAAYSEIQRYSVVQYLLDHLEDPSATTDQKELYLNLLNYGASAQKVLNYRTDRLATDKFFSVHVDNGSFINGERMWLVHAGDSLPMTALIPEEGSVFVKWTDWEKDMTVGVGESITLTAENFNIYTAHCFDAGSFIEYVLSYDEKSYMVAGINDSSLSSIVIPDTYNGRPVTAISHSVFANNSNLTSIVLPDGIATIGWRAFAGCSALKSLSLPGKLNRIEDYTFADCSELTELDIYNKLIMIGERAFSGCYALQSIRFHGTVYEWDCVQKEQFWNDRCGEFVVYCNDGTVYPDGRTEMFSEGLAYQENADGTLSVSGIGPCTETRIEIPSQYHGKPVTQIAISAFDGNTSIVEVILPDSITEIGSNAFRGCSALEKITMPGKMKQIGTTAFSGCTALKEIAIPKTDKIIRSETFLNCTSLETVFLPDTKVDFEDQAFGNCTSLKSVVYDDSIGSWLAYAGSGSWKTLFGNLKVYCADGLLKSDGTRIYYSEGLDFDGSETCAYVIGIGSCRDFDVVIPERYFGLPVTKIADNAFRGCATFTSIRIPDNVTDIGEQAFKDCAILENVTGGEGLQTIGFQAFESCNMLKEITLPDGLKNIDAAAFVRCNSLQEITIPGSVTIPGGVMVPGSGESKPDSAFSVCGGLVRATLCEGITTVAHEMFMNCRHIREVSLPGSLILIESEAFMQCGELDTIRFNGTLDEWDQVEKESTWDKETGEYTVYCTDGYVSRSEGAVRESVGLEYSENADGTYSLSGLGDCTDTTVVIPGEYDGKPVTNIAQYAFRSETVTKVVFGRNLTSLEASAFLRCENLADVELVGRGTWVCNDGNKFEPTRLDTPGSDSAVVALYLCNWRALYPWTFEPEE